MPRILVTGSAGFIGYSISTLLLKKKYEVIGLDNLSNYYDIRMIWRKRFVSEKPI